MNTSVMEPLHVTSPEATNINDDSIFEYDVCNGSCYIYCCFSVISYGLFLPCYCVAHKLVTSQQARIVNNNLNFRFDCWFWRSDQMVPLDRIQDVAINENCCHRCWGVSDLTVQTAGGGQKPEVVITAVKNPHRVRDYILQRRDEVASTSNGTDGTNPVVTRSSSVAINQDSKVMNDTLTRIEKLIELGLKQHGTAGVQTDKIHQDSEASPLLA